MKHLFVSMSVKQNLFVSVFVHKCLMMLNDVEYATFKMSVTQMSNYFFVISFQLIFFLNKHYTVLQKYTYTGLKQNLDIITRLLDNAAFVCVHVAGRSTKDFSEVRGLRSPGFQLQV